ncbi:cholesterol 7-desaturase-like [Acanthaster planci]|uniref:cholesterol 7-desaturase n=1 Tax=Acanthaster planci TaxID=133434 RepID=A0A8B7Y777_ACAPL|nr:cholesterol 7-desaturase-like [Acanthaster planci]
MKRSRKIGDMPPVYPNGLNLAVFRGESGRAYIVDAYCPHLGANLAVGGKVTGECIECPFHGWTYQGEDGKCVKIGYAEKVPDFVKVPTYRSLEINNLILLWYHAEGEEPSWYPPEVEKIKSGELMLDGTWEVYLDCHIQDVVENGGDATHLDYVHGPQIFPKNFINVKWEVHSTKKHVSISDSQTLPFYSSKPFVRNIQEQYGPGLSYVFGNEFLLVGAVPVGPLRQKIVFSQYSRSTSVFGIFRRLFMKLLLYWTYVVIKGDVFIWANKTYKKTPQLVKEDKFLLGHRRWFSQFYTEHSPRYNPPDPLQW